MISIYAGAIPSTTFIERLIRGLSRSGQNILLVGRQIGPASYPTNVKLATFRDNRYLWIKGIIAYLRLNKESRNRIKSLRKPASTKSLLKTYLITYQLLKHKCEVFHIQWAKDLENWIFLKEFGIKVVLSLRGAHINYSP